MATSDTVQSRQTACDATGETKRFLRAASIALQQFPGPAGQLLHREILGYLQLREQLANSQALVPHLVADLLNER